MYTLIHVRVHMSRSMHVYMYLNSFGNDTSRKEPDRTDVQSLFSVSYLTRRRLPDPFHASARHLRSTACTAAVFTGLGARAFTIIIINRCCHRICFRRLARTKRIFVLPLRPSLFWYVSRTTINGDEHNGRARCYCYYILYVLFHASAR